MTLKELQEQAGKLAKQIRDHSDAYNARVKEHEADSSVEVWPAEDRAAYDKVNAEYDSVAAKIEAKQEDARVAARLAEIDDFNQRTGQDRDPGQDTGERRGGEMSDAEARGLVLQAWMRNAIDEPLEDRHTQAMQRNGVRHLGRNFNLRLGSTSRTMQQRQHIFRTAHPSIAESRALSVGTDASGGYTAPDGFINRLETNMLAFGGPLQVAEIMYTSDGNEMDWPTADDTSNEGVLVSEAADASATADPSFGNMKLNAYKLSSKFVKISQELLEDNAVGLGDRIGGMLGERLGRGGSNYWTTGTGSSQPNGIVTASTLGVTAASATAITADELMKLVHKVDPAYRQGAGFMLHDDIILAIRMLKDGDGQYLWRAGLQDGVPDRLLNYSMTVNQKMDNTLAVNKKPVLFGQLSKYKIRIVRNIRLKRLEERYAENDQVGFVAFLRIDGDLLDAGTAPVKHLKMAAA